MPTARSVTQLQQRYRRLHTLRDSLRKIDSEYASLTRRYDKYRKRILGDMRTLEEEAKEIEQSPAFQKINKDVLTA